MSNANDFVLAKTYKGEELKKYTGNEEHIVIPEGIVSIGGHAFRNCASIVSVHIPDSVEQINFGAFENCSNLKDIRMPKMKNTYSVSETAFEGCISLADENGFFICNNVLYRYFGNAETVVVPEGVEAIGQGAFSTCYSVKEIVLPQTIHEIGNCAFGEMNNITIRIPKETAPKTIRDSAFEERGYDEYAAHFGIDAYGSGAPMIERQSVQYVLDFACEDGGHTVYNILRLKTDYTDFKRTFSAYTSRDGVDFKAFDEAVMQGKRYKGNDKLYAALLRMTYPKGLNEDTQTWHTDFLKKNVKKAVTFACETDSDIFIKTLIDIEAINAKNLKALKKLVTEANAAKCLAMIESA